MSEELEELRKLRRHEDRKQRDKHNSDMAQLFAAWLVLFGPIAGIVAYEYTGSTYLGFGLWLIPPVLTFFIPDVDR